MGIYVEAFIRGEMDELWHRTQTPELHEQWDARFTSITYSPRADESQPQRFSYSTRIGFGLSIDGEGETICNRQSGSGHVTSSLRFWSSDPKSLIREGAGYWQYVSTDCGIRFITGYDYQTRFGWIGSTFDGVVFRPIMGWATAWSFDRLRLWIERGIDPAVSMQRSVMHVICRVTVASVWFYQGIVPKLVAQDKDEFKMLEDAGVPQLLVPLAATAFGCAEILLGTAVLVFFAHRWPFSTTILLMVLATVGVAIYSPRYMTAAFNPVSLNLLLAVVSFIGLTMMTNLPSARHCLRKKPGTL